MDYWGYELGPIRPPSEARSLLIRITRNCHWNRCTFCPIYKEKEFSIRPVEHVKKDIDVISNYIDLFKSAESENEEMMLVNQAHPVERFGYRSALLWFRNGMKSVFLQDADSLIIPPSNVIQILEYLREKFPAIERVTSYARSSTVTKIPEQDLAAIRDAGLNRLHLGMESGSDEVLKRVRKGASKKIHIVAGQKIKAAGIELSEYVMPGLGGVKFSEAHALEPADALNQIDPDFIRLRQVATPDGKILYEDFERCTDLEVVRELKQLIDHLEVRSSYLASDHILNLLPEIEGKLPEDKTRILNAIQRFLNMDTDTQIIYQLGRRMGIFLGMKDLDNPQKVSRVREIYESQAIGPENINDIVNELMQRFI